MATGEGTGTPASSTEPVTRTEAKAHLRVDHTNDDSYIDGLITSARKRAEQFLHRKLLEHTLTGYLDEWPSGDSIILPFGNLQSVSTVKYTDTDGDQSTFDSGDYIEATETEPGQVILAYGESWPSVTLYPSNPIEIIFVAGYGAAASDVPEPIRHAIKLIIGDMYENREDIIIGAISSNLKAAINLMTMYKFYTESEVRVI